MERSLLVDLASPAAMAQASSLKSYADLHGCDSRCKIQQHHGAKLAGGAAFFGAWTAQLQSQAGARNAVAKSISSINQATSISTQLSAPAQLCQCLPVASEFSSVQRTDTYRLVSKALPSQVLLERSEASYENFDSLAAAGFTLTFAKAANLPLFEAEAYAKQSEDVSIEKDQMNLEQSGIMVGSGDDDKEKIEVTTSAKKAKAVLISSRRRLERTLRRKRIQQNVEKHPTLESGELPAEKASHSQGNHDKKKFRNTKTRLLTPAEENKLAMATKELMRMEEVKRKLLKILGREPTSSEWSKALKMESSEFTQKLRNGLSCRHKLFASNNGLVQRIARNNQAKGAELSDLIQDGKVGLFRSIQKFDVDKGFRFSTYASIWIKAGVLRSMSKRCAPVHVPAHIFGENAKIVSARKTFIEDHAEAPTDEQVAALAGMSVERLRTITTLFKPYKSLDKPLGKEQTATLKDFVADENVESPFEVAENALREKHIEQALQTLTWREKEVIQQRFGMYGGTCKTLQEIGTNYNLTRERVRQIQENAIKKLQDPETCSVLQSFVETKARKQKTKLDKAGRKNQNPEE